MDELMKVFRQTYLEESFDGLSSMEGLLLTIPLGRPDNDIINTIFRAAHSMKGGAGTFGFTELIHLTHILETMLDQMRSGKRDIDNINKEALLQSVDVLRNILTAYQNEDEVNIQEIKEMEDILEKILGMNEQDVDDSISKEQEHFLEHNINHFHIRLEPTINHFDANIDLLKLINELKSKTKEFSLTPTLLNNIEYTQNNMSLFLDIKGELELEDIQEVFEWLDKDSCVVSITPIAKINEVKETKEKAKDSLEEHKVKESIKKDDHTKKEVESTIRVGISKIDQMVDMVGEMVISQSILSRFGQLAEQINAPWADELKEGLLNIARHTRSMQEAVMSIRMMPISFAFNRMPRIVHDVSAKLGKDIELVLEGENTEVDKTVLEKLTDPLVHIIRNSVDHGIEMPDVREKAGKNRKGKVLLSAFHSGGNIVIQIKDDGAGIRLDKVKKKAIECGIISETQTLTEKENIDLIFHAGFSTADEITDISGRGVGMDVVRRNIQELGGSIEVQTEQGKGSVFTIRLPLTLAILDGQLAKIGQETYIFPLASIIETVLPEKDNIKTVKGVELYRLRDEYIQIIRLNKFFNRQNIGVQKLTEGLLVFVENGDKKFGVFVDILESQQQVVIKSLEANYKKVNGLSGATIMGDGKVALILDLTELASNYNTPE